MLFNIILLGSCFNILINTKSFSFLLYNSIYKREIRFLTNLKELNLSGNNFSGLPAEIGQLANLEVLNLANNPLTGLPQELGNLKNLKVLDLRGTQYAAQDLVGIKASLSSSVQILVD